MKIFLPLFISFLAVNVFPASIQCVDDLDRTINFSDDSEDKLNDLEVFWGNCQTEVFHGSICFTGDRKETIDLINSLNDYDFFGGEYEVMNTWYVGKQKLKYEIYDGPNDLITQSHIISRCEEDSFDFEGTWIQDYNMKSDDFGNVSYTRLTLEISKTSSCNVYIEEYTNDRVDFGRRENCEVIDNDYIKVWHSSGRGGYSNLFKGNMSFGNNRNELLITYKNRSYNNKDITVEKFIRF